MIGFPLFFNPTTNNLHFVEVYTQRHRLDHHLSSTNTLLNTRRKRYGAMGTANGEDQLCIILGVVLCCSDGGDGLKVADGHLVPLFYIRKGNNCFRRIGNEEIFTT